MSAKISLDLSIDNFINLDSKEIVSLLDTLIYIELSKLGLRKDEVVARYNIQIADDSIVGALENVTSELSSRIVFKGKTYYKVKSGADIDLSESGLRSLILQNKILHPNIKAVAQADGQIVLCFPGLYKQKLEGAERALLKIIRETIPQTKVKVKTVQANDLVEIAERYLTLDLDM